VPAQLVVVGVSHHTATVEVRERLAFPEGELEGVVTELVACPEVGEAVLLSTCNRVEIYAATRQDDAGEGGARRTAQRLLRFLAEARGVEATLLERHAYERLGGSAVSHVFRVASSLDSLVVGEAQILGQLKSAYEIAARAGGVGPLLGRCLERAFSVAKRVRTETAIAHGAANVASVAVELGERIFGDLAGRKVLVIGAGKMSGLAARHLASRGAAEVVVANRSPEKAEALAREVGGIARPFAELEQLLGQADVVISSTGASRPIIDHALLKRVMKARRHADLFVIDIAVPRDVEPVAGKLDGVYLFDVDDLEKVVAENLAERGVHAAAAARIVEAETAQFDAWLRAQGAVPTIKELRERCAQIARAEAERTIAQLGGPEVLGEKQQKAIRLMAESIVNKMLHKPLMALKDPEAAEALVAATRRLFELPAVLPAAKAEKK
jgi:glutamyl-tRNA reductase